MNKPKNSSKPKILGPPGPPWPACPPWEDPRLQDKKGLYDPKQEHDNCGIGFVANIKGEASHQIVQDALTVLQNLHHRGATGADPDTGDGAGILCQIPHKFFLAKCREIGIELPEPGKYGVGMVFLPSDPNLRRECEMHLEDVIHREGQRVLGWRTVPTQKTSLGESARATAPFVRQVFIRRGRRSITPRDFERRLYTIRRVARKEAIDPTVLGAKYHYIPSISRRTIIYKGMLTSSQLTEFYPDLKDPDFASAIALVHSRFSTNTFPSWERAQPCRYIIHNGEINTLQGNINWFRAREKHFKTPLFGKHINKILPILDISGSDSSVFDNCFEFIHLAGRSVEQAFTLMIPEPWQSVKMREAKRAYYEYHACLMEPWDGPAAIAFTDGVKVGAALDRNGLRPARYVITDDDRVILASEMGVLPIAEEKIVKKGRLRPGRLFLIDTEKKEVVSDWEIKSNLAGEHPYEDWLKNNLVRLEELPNAPGYPVPDSDTLFSRQVAYGYTQEDLHFILTPMAESGKEPLAAMGNDTPLAVLSDRPQELFSYFKQLFAQVTNPPIDAIREELITGQGAWIGPEGNLLGTEEKSCRQVHMSAPILSNEDLAKLRHIERAGFHSQTLTTLYQPNEENPGLALELALDRLALKAQRAIEKKGADILILSDRGVDKKNLPIPSLLATAAVHHHLIRAGIRTKVGLVIETGEAREVHHFCTLIGYGAAAVNPYLAFETVKNLVSRNFLPGTDYPTAVKNVIKALSKGIIKVLSKMGISTVGSYCGAQIFEAVGIKQEVVDQYFTGTSSRIEGIGLDEIGLDSLKKHHNAFSNRLFYHRGVLDWGGNHKWRAQGELHQYEPESIRLLQLACRTNDFTVFQTYSKHINDETKRLKTLRGLMQFRSLRDSVPINSVESVESIMARFKTGAMSYGSLGKEAHESLAIAMNRLGGRSNSGEGGEDSERLQPKNGDSANSAIKQVASGRFGVTSEYLLSARELQIKIAQGAKPGEGGQLPGKKVYPWIAKVRHSTPGVGLISPPPHHDIYSIEDIAQLIHDLKNANDKARVSVKLVSSVGVGTIAAGVAKAKADLILISGYDGGTGASPIGSIKNAGVPWELGLSETHQTLVFNDLRSRITLEVDGQLKTGRDVVIGAILGAEEFGFGTGPLVALGCVMMRACHLNTCPVGVATQDPALRKKFTGKPAYVENYMRFIAQEVRELMAELGVRKFVELIGHTHFLKERDHFGSGIGESKAANLDLSRILYFTDAPEGVWTYNKYPQDHALGESMDKKVLIPKCQSAVLSKTKITESFKIQNTDRVVGTQLGSLITRTHGGGGLEAHTITLKFEGSAGQSFGAFIPQGLSLFVSGDANDYVGKGLSGGCIAIHPSKKSQLIPNENVIIGNVALFGATSGEAFVSGQSGERFAVRNSGASAVVEGVGDHGCEYMTGGIVIVLGRIGKNFAAGMSGGIAYVYDERSLLPVRCNMDLVDLEFSLGEEDKEIVKILLEKHFKFTSSPLAKSILEKFQETSKKFTKVIPRDYQRAIEKQRDFKAKGYSSEEAMQLAFEQGRQN